MKESKVVLFPTMGVSHMIPMVQLAKLFVSHGISAEIAVINTPVMPASTTKFISEVSTTDPKIAFTLLAPLSPDPEPAPSRFISMLRMIRSNNTELRSHLRSLLEAASVAVLIVDFFCVDALEVAAELGIPAYVFFTCGANVLAVFIRLTELVSTWDWTKTNMRETPIEIPGIPLLHLSDAPEQLLEYGGEDQKAFMNVFKRIPEANGILINTFEALETRAVKVLQDGHILSTRLMPPIYCIGPLVAAADDKAIAVHPCLQWLDAQPKKSVVYVSFGSRGNFPVDQLREIALGLEKSGQKFIWVVRNPPSGDLDKVPYNPLADPDLDALLPEGFLNRTKDQGFIVRSWAPQVEILHHESVGGFVSHCGWSSTLEAITNGVPIISWPLFAEQKMNRVFLIEEMKMAVKLDGCDEGFVSRDELAEKVRWLMESEGGNELRSNACAHKINGLDALREGGKSELAFLEFMSKLGI